MNEKELEEKIKEKIYEELHKAIDLIIEGEDCIDILENLNRLYTAGKTIRNYYKNIKLVIEELEK